MNQVPIKLGPLALLLTVISICLTVLSILTFTTSGADLRLAQRYADTVKARYALESEGQAFLQRANEAVRAGQTPGEYIAQVTGSETGTSEAAGTESQAQTFDIENAVPGAVRRPAAAEAAEEERAGSALEYVMEKDDMRLTIGLADTPDADGGVRVTQWKMERVWRENTSIGNIWQGQ
ncbi:MAG: hypothetical protein IJG52_02855 [Lachnospiraceae bacterium]|nr:hypothetical protein [Lachnospiraceae bacterium]